MQGGDVIVSINGERVNEHERAIAIIEEVKARCDGQDKAGRIQELQLSYVPGPNELYTISLLDSPPEKAPGGRATALATKLMRRVSN